VVLKSRMSARDWWILALLVLAGCINYIDRGSLSIAAPAIRRELSLTPTEIGILLSAFFWTYATFQIVAGWLVDRYPVNLVMTAGFFIWSLATGATALAGGFGVLFALRILLGAGEAVAYPAFSKIITTSFPERHRGLTNSLIDAGTRVGPALGTLIGGLLVDQYGWRILFVALGIGSMLWLVPWSLTGHREYKSESAVHLRDVGFGSILKQRSAWGTFIGLFCLNYGWYFLLTWLPTYLVEERHFSMRMMAILGSLPFWGAALMSSIGGWTSDRLIERGFSVTRVRKSFAATGLLLCTLVLPASLVQDSMVSLVLISIAALALGLTTSNNWAISQTLAGPSAAGKWTGAQNCFGNFAGVTAPYVTGVIIAKTGSYHWAFVSVTAFLIIGALSFAFVVGPLKEVDWEQPAS
jgi:MFS transporter, ACS family, D-galactonate transporter